MVSGRVLPLCRDAVGVFYSPSRLGQLLLWVRVFLGTISMKVYSTFPKAPSSCHHILDIRWKGSYPSVDVFYSPCWLNTFPVLGIYSINYFTLILLYSTDVLSNTFEEYRHKYSSITYEAELKRNIRIF